MVVQMICVVFIKSFSLYIMKKLLKKGKKKHPPLARA